MVYFIVIKKTKHYEENHEQDIAWSEVIEIIFKSSKNIKKKDDKYEIETDEYYILMELKNKILYVINAKRRRWVKCDAQNVVQTLEKLKLI